MIPYYQNNAYRELSVEKLTEMKKEQLKIIEDAQLDLAVARNELEIINQRLYKKEEARDEADNQR